MGRTKGSKNKPKDAVTEAFIEQLKNDPELVRRVIEKLSEKEVAVVAKADGAVTSPAVEHSDDKPPREIRPDEYISVMSLLPYTLILSTKPFGEGIVRRFTQFGEVKRLLYSELVEVLETCSGFLEKGYFYILDRDVIRRHGLDELYSKILSKEKIMEILEGRSKEAFNLYSSASREQKEVIISMIIEKLVSNPESVDMNLVDKISKESGINISERASDERFIINKEQE